ncbi:MAG: iron-sulfur cluster assembly scaffold protein [Bryobacteraceae bacterium]|nr:iron-sulfur cluster assembly scaffold protein [Bryobacteraceae bacterium]
MYSAELLDHFANPRNAGHLEAPAISVEVVNPACGDILRLAVLWSGDVVEQAAFQVRGCTAALAAGSALTGLIKGRSRRELAHFQPSELEEVLGGLPTASRHVTALCADAIKAALKS